MGRSSFDLNIAKNAILIQLVRESVRSLNSIQPCGGEHEHSKKTLIPLVHVFLNYLLDRDARFRWEHFRLIIHA